MFGEYALEHNFPVIGRRIMLLNARELRAGSHTEMLVLAMEDVTEKRQVHDLELRFTAGLQESYARLQGLETLRDDLTRMIIHDLRTPLTSVITGMQTPEVVGDLNADQQEMMEIAVAGGETLLGMINALLDVERLEDGSMPLDGTALSAADLVAAAVSQVASLAERERLTLRQLAPAGLPLLLGNAIKFTPPGGTITAGASCADGFAVFTVSDTGEGIPAEAFERIFEKFGQVASRRGGRTMSTGLGLTFCKLTVEAHGGQIAVESLPGQGSTIRFTIPLAPPEQEPTFCK